MRRMILCLTLGGILWGGSLLALHQHGTLLREDRTRFVVPPAKALRPVATDFENLIADSYWLLFLQMNGEQLQIEDLSKRDYRHAFATLDLIGELDPSFHEAALFGSWVLADGDRLEEARRLLVKGHARHPEDYRYPFQLGFLEFLCGKRYLDAAQWFETASKLPEAPPAASRMAASMYQKGSKTDLAIQTWTAIYRAAQDKQTRAIAERALRKLGVAL